MFLDSFVDQHNYTKAVRQAMLHRRVSMVGYNPLAYEKRKGRIRARIPSSISNQTVCQCCGRFPREPIRVNFDINEIGFLGSGHALYFAFQKLCIALLGSLLLIVLFYRFAFDSLAKRIGSSQHILGLSKTDVCSLLVTVVCTALIHIFASYMVELDIRVDEMDTSPEDYSVWISNIPISVPQLSSYDPEQQLRTFFETAFKHQLKVSDICLCYNLVPMMLLKQTKRELLEAYRKYYLDRDRKQIVSSILFNTEELPFQMQEFYGVLPSSEARDKLRLKNIEECYQEELQELNQTINKGYASSELLFLGEAVISFETQEMKQYVLASNRTFQSYFYGHLLQYRKTPHPKGIFWYNLHLRKDDYALRSKLSVIVCTAVVLVSFCIQLFLSYCKVQLQGHPLAARVAAFMHPVFINLVNFLIPPVMLNTLPKFEGPRNRSEEMLSFVKKSVLLQLLNTLLLPFIVRQFITHELEAEFIARHEGILFRNSLFILFGLTIAKRYIAKELSLKAFERGIAIKKLVKSLVTVREYCEMYEFPVFELDYRAGEIIKTMLLTFVFAHESYRVVLYALICQFCSYWIDKYNLARRRTVIYHINASLNNLMMRLVHVAVTAFLLMMIITHGFSTAKVVLLAISLFFCANPAMARVRRRGQRAKEEFGRNLRYSACKRKIFETDYRRENPAIKGHEHLEFYGMFASREDPHETTSQASAHFKSS